MKLFKNKIFIICILFFIFLFFSGINHVFASVDIPDVVIQKAKELNYGVDNVIVLQDKNTGLFYIPYETSDYNHTNLATKPWRYTFYNNVYCIVTPNWWKTGLMVYQNNTFTTVSTSNVGSNSIIQMSMNGRELEIVYSSKDVLYYNIEGVENGTVFFPLPVTEIPETTIPALETVEQIPTAMVETLKMIIPVGLVVLSVVLLIYLIKSVISHTT